MTASALFTSGWLDDPHPVTVTVRPARDLGIQIAQDPAVEARLDTVGALRAAVAAERTAVGVLPQPPELRAILGPLGQLQARVSAGPHVVARLTCEEA